MENYSQKKRGKLELLLEDEGNRTNRGDSVILGENKDSEEGEAYRIVAEELRASMADWRQRRIKEMIFCCLLLWTCGGGCLKLQRICISKF